MDHLITLPVCYGEYSTGGKLIPDSELYEVIGLMIHTRCRFINTDDLKVKNDNTHSGNLLPNTAYGTDRTVFKRGIKK